MLAALLLAACAIDPVSGLEEQVFYPAELDGPLCSQDRQFVECGCSECLTWDPVPGPVVGYQVERVTMSTGATYLFDLPLQVNVDPDTGDVSTYQQMIWCLAESAPFPVEGTVYRIRVRAYFEGPNYGDFSNEVFYRAAPYWCGVGGDEAQCYVGDPVADR